MREAIDLAHPAYAGVRPAQPASGDGSARLLLAVLACFTCDEPALTLRGVAEQVGADEATVEGLLRLACASGLLSHDDERGLFGAGIRSLEMASSFQAQSDLIGAAADILRFVRDSLGETTKLIVRWRDQHVGIAQARSRQTIDQATPLGKLKPLYVGAGKVLLASLPPDELDDYLARTPLVRHSPTTITDRSELEKSLAAIRKAGLFETYSERNQGGVSLAVPVRDHAGAVVAALVASMPIYRYRQEVREKAQQLLSYGVERISERLSRRRFREGPRSRLYS